MRDTAQERFEALFGPEFGHGKALDRSGVERALTALGPAMPLPPTFHIAGTNGKGSTIAFMRAIAEAAGLKVHAFTKPHLFALNERFVVASEIVSNEALIAVAEIVAHAVSGLTQFDAQVAAALYLFAEHDADLVLLETGMGGRDDSTNVIRAPTATVITPIGLDHQDALGVSIEEISLHKAGILKRLSPAVIAGQAPAAMAILEAAAHEVGAPLYRRGVEWDCHVSNGRLVVQNERRALDLPMPALHGAHQADNAGLACAAFLAPGPFSFSDDAFASGVSTARWGGRLEPLMRGPFSAPIRAVGGEVWVDAGHNAHAAEALARALLEMKRKRGGANIAIVGLRARKDAGAFVAALAPGVDHIIAVPLPETHAALSVVSPHTAPSLAAAMQDAAQFPAPRVAICGSLLLAAEALAAERV